MKHTAMWRWADYILQRIADRIGVTVAPNHPLDFT